MNTAHHVQFSDDSRNVKSFFTALKTRAKNNLERKRDKGHSRTRTNNVRAAGAGRHSNLFLKVPRQSVQLSPRDVKESKVSLLQLVLNNQKSHDLFSHFADEQHCLENVMLWDSMNQYKRCKDEEMKRILAGKIYEAFLCDTPELECNLTERVKTNVKNQIEKGLYNNTLFEDIEFEIEVCLGDVLNRFVQTQEYKLFTAQNEWTNE
jgi:hypothetical protein